MSAMNFNHSLCYMVLIFLCNLNHTNLVSNQVECGDENCSVAIGSGNAQTVITTNKEGYVTMRKGEEGQIFGIVGTDLFLVETQTKKRGFVSQKLFRENRRIRKDLVKTNKTAVKNIPITSNEALTDEQISTQPTLLSQTLPLSNTDTEIKKTENTIITSTTETTEEPNLDKEMRSDNISAQNDNFINTNAETLASSDESGGSDKSINIQDDLQVEVSTQKNNDIHNLNNITESRGDIITREPETVIHKTLEELPDTKYEDTFNISASINDENSAKPVEAVKIESTTQPYAGITDSAQTEIETESIKNRDDTYLSGSIEYSSNLEDISKQDTFILQKDNKIDNNSGDTNVGENKNLDKLIEPDAKNIVNSLDNAEFASINYNEQTLNNNVMKDLDLVGIAHDIITNTVKEPVNEDDNYEHKLVENFPHVPQHIDPLQIESNLNENSNIPPAQLKNDEHSADTSSSSSYKNFNDPQPIDPAQIESNIHENGNMFPGQLKNDENSADTSSSSSYQDFGNDFTTNIDLIEETPKPLSLESILANHHEEKIEDSPDSQHSVSSNASDIVDVETVKNISNNIHKQEENHKTSLNTATAEAYESDNILKENINYANTENIPGYCETKEPLNPETIIEYVYQRWNDKEAMIYVTDKIIEKFDVILVMIVIGTMIVVFWNVSYCLKQCNKEKYLITKLNKLEKMSMNLFKENAELKGELTDLKEEQENVKECSINNEQVVILKNQLHDKNNEVGQLLKQTIALKSELHNSELANAELNTRLHKIDQENKNHASSFQEIEILEKQINEQKLTIESLNQNLAKKTKEFTNMQQELSNTNAKLSQEIKSIKSSMDDVELEKICVENELKNIAKTFEEKLYQLEMANKEEMERINQKLSKKEKEAIDLHQKFRSSEAKVHVLNQCIAKMKNADPTDVLNSAEAKVDLLLLQNEYGSLQEQLTREVANSTSLKAQIADLTLQVDDLRNQNDLYAKDKGDAQTKLEILTSYFKEKENELQRELNMKEAIWLKQQGETTTTIERVRAMQEEIQHLRSQNDSLKTEIVTQDAAHKTQVAVLENKAHESWLTVRQCERKLEELRSETTLLRRRLTSIAESQTSSLDANISNNRSLSVGEKLPSDINIPSPMRIESPKTQMIGSISAIPFIPPPPFMTPIPPPPFIPNEISSLGRMMTSPPLNSYSRGFSPSGERFDRNRYSPESRYRDDYSVMTPYDTETDFSPPQSPIKNKSIKKDRHNGRLS